MIQTLPLDYLAKYISTFVTPIFSIPLSSSASSQSILQSLYDSSHLLIISCFDAYKIHVVRQFWFWYFEYCLEEFNRDGDKFVLYKGVGGVVKGLGGVKIELLDDEHYKDKDKDKDVADGNDSRDGNEKALDYILQRLKKELEDWKGLHVRLNRLSPSKPTPAQPIVDISDHTSVLSQSQSQTPSYLFLLKTIASLTTVVPIQYFYKLQVLLTDLLKPESWDVDVNWGVRYIDLLSIVFAEVSKTGLKLDVESFRASYSNLNTANSVNPNESSPSPSNPASSSSTESSTSSTSSSAVSSNPPSQPPPQREQPQNPYTVSPSYLAQLTTDIDFTNPNPNPNNPSSLGNPIDSVDLLRREEISRWWNKLVWEYLGYREAERLSHSDELKNLNGKKQERDGKSKIDARL
ncbi:hypothetical protein BKA69DRAFT_1073389 [Paraphysoderma sedebokerense]|nr:hypothetical protein BKA69DRAFT_1073389 [Paraphysoderma sedebokerense]